MPGGSPRGAGGLARGPGGLGVWGSGRVLRSKMGQKLLLDRFLHFLTNF